MLGFVDINPAEVLSAFLTEQKITQEVFAARVGATQCTVSKWCKGRSKPSLGAAVAIERETGIRAELWGGKWVAQLRKLELMRRRVA
jgi:transcriptional regulator with XRE-family HTH domain